MSVLFLNFKYDKITDAMDKFIVGDDEGKPYDSIWLSGFVPKKSYYQREASVVLEPVKYNTKMEYVSLSEIKKEGLMRKDFISNYYFSIDANRLILNNYLFTDDEIIYIKAQCSNDRKGFYKEFWDGCLVDEKNYGDCSCFFKMKELIVYPENF